MTLAALSCRPRSLEVVTELLGMEGSVFSLTRSSEGFGMDLDRRGVIVGYTGSARPAEVAYMPLGAVVTAVDGKEVGFSLPRLLCVCVCVCVSVCLCVCVSVSVAAIAVVVCVTSVACLLFSFALTSSLLCCTRTYVCIHTMFRCWESML